MTLDDLLCITEEIAEIRDNIKSNSLFDAHVGLNYIQEIVEKYLYVEENKDE